jgi:hypothetical protein
MLFRAMVDEECHYPLLLIITEIIHPDVALTLGTSNNLDTHSVYEFKVVCQVPNVHAQTCKYTLVKSYMM